ncbi:TPA: type 1 fimbrial protein, partial [Enterobacter asburiae]|nr:type 1 fimbrial protein [Enterobacter asburiae]
MHFSGALVAEPCTLPDSDTDIHVDFGTVIVKYLYQYQRTKSQMFTIHLENCDPSILKTVSVTFKGTTDDELTDMLTLDTSSSAKGIAIGLELNDGVLLAVNKSSPATQLVSGKNSLTFG